MRHQGSILTLHHLKCVGSGSHGPVSRFVERSSWLSEWRVLDGYSQFQAGLENVGPAQRGSLGLA